LEQWRLADQALRLLAERCPDFEPPTCLLKVVAVNELYGTSGGGPFSSHALIASPEGGKLAVFNMNNKPGPSGYSLDQGKTWESFESVGRNWDFGAVDWDSKTLFALRHEHDGAHLSTDFGKSWKQLDLKRGPISGAGVFGARDLVISRGGKIERSDDAG